MRIVLTGVDCPRLPGVTVGVQRGKDVLQESRADGREITWLLEAELVGGQDLRGPYVHGPPGGRFLYLSWQRQGSGMFGRAKLMLDVLSPQLLSRGEQDGLTARVPLTMPDGRPVCAAVRPPRIEWSVLAN